MWPLTLWPDFFVDCFTCTVLVRWDMERLLARAGEAVNSTAASREADVAEALQGLREAVLLHAV